MPAVISSVAALAIAALATSLLGESAARAESVPPSTTTSTTSMAADPRHAKLLVLDFKAAPNAASLAHVLTQEAAAALGGRGYDVVAMAELKDAIALQGEKQFAGCDDAGCAADLAGALGAELVVFGDVTRVDDVIVVGVQLFDARRNQLLAREVARGKSVDDVARATRAAVRTLLPSTVTSPLVIGGLVAAAAGAALVVAGGAITLWAAATLSDRNAPRTTKDAALTAEPIAVVVAGVGAVAVVVGAACALLALE